LKEVATEAVEDHNKDKEKKEEEAEEKRI